MKLIICQCIQKSTKYLNLTKDYFVIQFKSKKKNSSYYIMLMFVCNIIN